METQEEYQAKRQHAKSLRMAYRDVAREIAAHITSVHESRGWQDFVSVPQYGHVAPGEGGAFVEAIIYVTKAQAEAHLIKLAGAPWFDKLTAAKDACEQLDMERRTPGSKALYQAVWHLWNRTPAGPIVEVTQHGSD